MRAAKWGIVSALLAETPDTTAANPSIPRRHEAANSTESTTGVAACAVLSKRDAGATLVGDAVTGWGPHGTYAVDRRAGVGDKRRLLAPLASTSQSSFGSSSPPWYANVEPSGGHVKYAASTEPSWRSSPVDTE